MAEQAAPLPAEFLGHGDEVADVVDVVIPRSNRTPSGKAVTGKVDRDNVEMCTNERGERVEAARVVEPSVQREQRRQRWIAPAACREADMRKIDAGLVR